MFEKNCKTFMRDLHGDPGLIAQKQAFYETVWHGRQEIPLAQGIHSEIQRLISPGENGERKHWQEIICRFYGLDENNPTRWSQEKIAGKLCSNPSTIQQQRYYALDVLSLSELLGQFFIV